LPYSTLFHATKGSDLYTEMHAVLFGDCAKKRAVISKHFLLVLRRTSILANTFSLKAYVIS